MSNNNISPLPWEQLVTEGHVRAARLRRVQPVLIGIATALIIVGVLLMLTIKPPQVENNRAKTLSTYVERQQWRVLEAFSGLPQPRLMPSEVANLVPGQAVLTIHKESLAGLNRTGDFPPQTLVQEVEPSAFWRAPWPKNKLIRIGKGDTYLLGGLINAGAEDYPQPRRIIVIYRRHGQDWSAVTVIAPDFAALPDTPRAPIESFPITLKPIIKLKERS